MPKASPLSNLSYEVVHMDAGSGSQTHDSEFFDQTVTREALSGTDTFKQDEMYFTERPDLELRKMGLSTGGSANPSSPVEGANAPGPEGSKEPY